MRVAYWVPAAYNLLQIGVGNAPSWSRTANIAIRLINRAFLGVGVFSSDLAVVTRSLWHGGREVVDWFEWLPFQNRGQTSLTSLRGVAIFEHKTCRV